LAIYGDFLMATDSRHCVSEAMNVWLLGSRCWQAVRAAWNWELLTPKACGLPLGRLPLLLGSG